MRCLGQLKAVKYVYFNISFIYVPMRFCYTDDAPRLYWLPMDLIQFHGIG